MTGGKIIYTNLNTSGVVDICIEALRSWGHSPQYIYQGVDTPGPKNYDRGTLISWKNGSGLIEVGEPDNIPVEFRKPGMPAGTRVLQVLPGCRFAHEQIARDIREALRARGVYVDSQKLVSDTERASALSELRN